MTNNTPKNSKDELSHIRSLLAPVFKETKTLKAIAFGSFAKKNQTRNSDLDLMIIVETDQRFFDRYEKYEKIHDLIHNRPVDMLIYTPNELSKISHRVFIKQILQEGKIIYES
ncbi:MAG: nucleotidyltransferase domain-containing protein [Proteobacteria bacterium]|nr:nucleotidyltransferase domain-containing protein [Pseudomonadota bacterium]